MRYLPLARVLAVLTTFPAQAPTAKVLDYLQRCERFGFSGSVLIARGGKVLLAQGYGWANRAEQTRNAKDTLFEIASTTKSFTAVAILQLEAEGKLSTDDSIAKHLPSVPKDREDITIYHLLTHTSGMGRRAGGFGEDLQKAVAQYFATKPVREPGVAHEYWNGGYALLAGIVERVSGGSYVDYCRQHIFGPAGMTSSGFTGDELEAKRVAVGYEGSDAATRLATEHPYRNYSWHYRGMGGLVTSVEDLYRFDRALRDDTLLPAKAREKLQKPFRDQYACGFYVLKEPRLEISHGGDVRGFHAQFCRYPKDDACIVILSNVGGIPTWAMAENLQALLFGDPSRYGQPPVTESWTSAQLEALAGTYARAPGERIHVRVDGTALELSADGVKTMRLLDASFEGKKDADPDLLSVAQTIVEAVAKGDAEPLRKQMNDGIPEDWPDRVRDLYWPAQVKKSGALQSVKVAGAFAAGEVTTVLLALEHAQGSGRVRIQFVGKRLQILDWNGPQALASCRAVPSAEGLLRFAWQGAQPEPIGLERKGTAVVGLRIGGVTYRR